MNSNFHTHTIYSDGDSSVERMIQRAIELKFTSIGFSDHSYTPIGLYGINPQKYSEYVAEMLKMKRKYSTIINVYCGIELDGTSVIDDDIKFEYKIGSLHFVKKGNDFIEVDRSQKCTADGINKFYEGNFYKFAKDYFEQLVIHNQKNNCNIVGHFDLISKFNENGAMYDENSPEYRNAWQPALYELLRDKNRIFEVNTGGMARGYRTVPYPTCEMLKFIKEQNGTVTITTDCHKVNQLDYGYSAANALIESVGVNCIDFETVLV